MANVFVSYARRDRERVLGVVSALEHEGLSVWWDPNLVPGKRFREIITRELEAADSVVVVWTATSILSDYVQDEAEEARERGVLVPVTLEPVKPPTGFRQVQAADLSQWTGSAQHPEFRILLSAVHALVNAARADEASARPEPDADDRAAQGATSAAPAEVPTAAPPAAGPQTSAPQATAPQPAAAPGAMLLPRLFDLFALPAVWLSVAGLVALAGLQVGFGLSVTAAALVIWAGASAQAGARLGPNRKMMVMVVSVGVALIVGASAHNASGVVTAVLVFASIFAGWVSILLTSRQASGRIRSQREAAHRFDYRAFGAEIERDVMEKVRRRHADRSRRSRSRATPDG